MKHLVYFVSTIASTMDVNEETQQIVAAEKYTFVLRELDKQPTAF